jgi:hypothetical protein
LRRREASPNCASDTAPRYEDVVVITPNGYENFTAFLPTELDDIEKLVGQGGVLQKVPAGGPISR